MLSQLYLYLVAEQKSKERLLIKPAMSVYSGPLSKARLSQMFAHQRRPANNAWLLSFA